MKKIILTMLLLVFTLIPASAFANDSIETYDAWGNYYYQAEILYIMSDAIPSREYFTANTGMKYADGSTILATGYLPHTGTILYPNGTSYDPYPHKIAVYKGNLTYYLW